MNCGRISRIAYFLLVLLTAALGLISRWPALPWPRWVTLYAGDVLWALLVYWLVRAAGPRCRVSSSSAGAVAVAFAVEFSQLSHAPWLVVLRGTVLGGLVLGHGFRWSDLLCYLTGIGLGWGLDAAWAASRSPQPAATLPTQKPATPHRS